MAFLVKNHASSCAPGLERHYTLVCDERPIFTHGMGVPAATVGLGGQL